MDAATEAIKEGNVAVRGHFMWRERFVVIKTGELVVRRRRGGSIKAKVDLLDDSVKLTFHGGQSLLTISTHGRDTVLNCGSSDARDQWINAVVSAQELRGDGTECDSADLVLSGEETDENDSHRQRRSTVRSMQPESRESDKENDDECSDVLLALQGVRDSMMQAHLSMGTAEMESFIRPSNATATNGPACGSRKQRRARDRASRSEDELRWRRLRSLLTFIESVPHGGRVVLLHLGVVGSAGITASDILLAFGEKQRDQPRGSPTASPNANLQKRYVAAFVRDLLFHPLYSQREEVNTVVVQELVDMFFPHCRLRRFSDDTKPHSEQPGQQSPPTSTHSTEAEIWTVSTAEAKAEDDAAPTLDSSSLPGAKAPPLRKKKRNHSFSNLLAITHLSKTSRLPSPATDSSSASTNFSSTASKEGPTRLRDNLSMLLSPLSPFQDSKGQGGAATDAGALLVPSVPGECDPMAEEAALPEPLRSLLWELTCTELAEQLTIFHHAQLSRVQPWELLHRPKETAKELTEHFNRLVAYFVWSVLVEDTPKERAEVIEDIISIAMAASAPPLSNFHLVMACVGCLGDTPLMFSRLPTTWKKVRAKYKTRLTELRRLCDHAGGFENLRRKQNEESVLGTSSASRTTSVIPFVGVIGVMLERLRSTSYFTPKKLLDFEKLERQYVALHVLENALLKPPPRPNRPLQRGKSLPTESAEQLTSRLQQFFGTLNMDFASARVHQLRSQQILGFETASSGTSSSSFYLSATTNTNSKGCPPPPTLIRNDSLSSVGSSDDAGVPFLSFRDICSLLVAVMDARERVQVALEALFVDDRQPAARFLRKFWFDFKQNVWISGAKPALLGVRACVAALQRDVLAHKTTELMQLSSLDENAADLHAMVYAKLVAVAVQPIYLKVLAKVKRACGPQDAAAAAALRSRISATDKVVHSSDDAGICCSGSHSSPMELLELVSQLVAVPRACRSPTTVSVEDQELAVKGLLRVLQHQGRETFLAKYPVSSLYLMHQVLDTAYLSPDQRAALQIFEIAVSCLHKGG